MPPGSGLPVDLFGVGTITLYRFKFNINTAQMVLKTCCFGGGCAQRRWLRRIAP
jgi:hypothetical protein